MSQQAQASEDDFDPADELRELFDNVAGEYSIRNERLRLRRILNGHSFKAWYAERHRRMRNYLTTRNTIIDFDIYRNFAKDSLKDVDIVKPFGENNIKIIDRLMDEIAAADYLPGLALPPIFLRRRFLMSFSPHIADRVQIVPHGESTLQLSDFTSLVEKTLNGFDAFIRDFMRGAGITVHTGMSVQDIYEKKEKFSAPGWNAIGLFDRETYRVIMPYGGLYENEPLGCENLDPGVCASTLGHEIGHGVDECLGRPSLSGNFKRAVQEETARMILLQPKSIPSMFNYFATHNGGHHHVASRVESERFAQIFGELLTGNAHISPYFPKATAIVTQYFQALKAHYRLYPTLSHLAQTENPQPLLRAA